MTLSPGQQERYLQYCEYLLLAGRHTNLTGIRSAEGVMRSLFLDSLTLVLALPNWAIGGQAVDVVDIGSGAGIPGMPLKVLFPAWRLKMVESVGKKAHFLETLIARLAVDHVAVLNARAEELATRPSHRDRADLCLARAVSALPSLIELCAPLVRPGGLLLFPKSGDISEELSSATSAETRLNVRFRDVTAIPESLGLGPGRVIVAYECTGKTPSGYPRRVGLAQTRPIGL